MHPLSGQDSQNVSGELRYKGTDPATVVDYRDLNQVVLSLFRLVTGAGLSLLADDAADLADDWNQILRAVRILAQKKVTGDAIFTGASLSYSPSLDISAIHLTDDGNGPYANAVLSLATNNPTRDAGRVLFVLNLTGQDKQITFTSGYPNVILEAGASCFVYARNSSGATVWYPAGLESGSISTTEIIEGSKLFWTDGRFDTRFAASFASPFASSFATAFGVETAKTQFNTRYRSAGAEFSSTTRVASYRRINGLVHLFIPYESIADMNGNALYLAGVSGADLPAQVQITSTDANLAVIIYGTLNGTATAFKMYASATDVWLQIGKLDGTAFGADDAVVIWAQTVTYEPD